MAKLDLKGKTMYQTILEASKSTPRALALYYQGKKISFSGFIKRIDRCADILSNTLGVKRNDVILIAQPNIPDVLVLFYACNKIGAIANLVHPFTPFNQVRDIIRKTNTKYAFMFEQRIAKEVEKYRDIADKIYVTRIEDDLPFFKKVFYHTFMNFKIRRKLGKWRGKFQGFKYLKNLKPSGKGSPYIQNKDMETSVLLHSGSTTGDPKTICLCDWNFNAITEYSFHFLGAEKEEINPKSRGMLAVLPSFHGFGLCMAMHVPLVSSFACILLPKFSPKEVVDAMNHSPMGIICGVPVMLESLLKDEKFLHNKHIKDIFVTFCGGDTISESLEERWNNAMTFNGGKSKVFEGYGLTEAVCVNTVNTYKFNRKGSIGKAPEGITFKIFDENNNEVPKGTLGEIVLKSPAVMNGYFKDEEHTKEAIVDGWLHTGDIGYMDEDDYIYFKQRKKRVIKVSGVGVFPTEVERLIESVPGVSACCAIRIPDARLQSAVKVFVVAKYFDEEGMREQIMNRCRQYLIRWAVPKEIEFRESLPLTKLNKIDFNLLQKEEDERRGVISE